MKKLLLFCLFLMIPISLIGQQMINNFDTASADTNYYAWFSNHDGKHYQTSGAADSAKGWILVNHVANPVQEGAGAMKLEYSAHNIEGWGGYTKLEHWNPDSSKVYDWSAYDSVAIWYYNSVKQSLAGRVELRFNLHDVSNSANGNKTYDVGQTEYYYSFHKVLDAEPGWNKIQLPLKNDPNAWNGEAFNMTGWSGVSGNGTLDADKIKGFSFEFSISGGGQGDYATGTVILDHMTLVGRKRVNFVFFNGRDIPTNLSSWSWGQSSIEVEQGAGPIAGTNALKWVQGNEWNNGWTGIGFSISPPYKMDYEWTIDTLKFKLKAEPGVGALRVQIEGGSGKVGNVFTPIADNQWHQYAFKLSEMVYQDNTSNLDPSNIGVLGMMAEASGIAGKVIYITDCWTGNPVIDVVAPAAPTGVAGVPGSYYNLVIWTDVPGEAGEVYNVYASENPITSLDSPDVNIVASNVTEADQAEAHYLYFPLKDKVVSYYYAVICKDKSGNVGPIATSGKVTNTAKGIATISLTPPANFIADGDISEWEATTIKPFIFKPSESHWSLGTFTDDNDLTATCYIAVDNDNLYFACDVIDNIYSYDPQGNFYEDDVIEFYVGLYNTTQQHNGFKRGEEPDYKFILLSDRLIIDQRSYDPPMYLTADERYEFINFGASDWAVEFKVPLDSIKTGGAKNDKRFSPINGMKIMMDICFHDSDAPNVRDGVLSFSPVAKDNSWQGPQNWGFTWVGDTNKVTAVEEIEQPVVVSSYHLEQNYPNPFNPNTTIAYSLAQAGKVQVEVYNTLGQKIETLVNKFQSAGRYAIQFDGSKLSSGMYFYKLTVNNFTQTRKMLLFK